MFGALLGALKGVGSGIGKGIKSMGQNLAGGAFGGGGFDWNKMGEAMQGFGQGAQMADPNSQIGAAASGIGGGFSKFGQKRAASNAARMGEGMISDQIMKSQNAPIETMEPSAGMGTLNTPAGMTPPTDDGMWERDSSGWRRKEGAKPLMY